MSLKRLLAALSFTAAVSATAAATELPRIVSSAVTLDRRALACYDTGGHDWRVDPGNFRVFVGNASDATALNAEFTIP